MSWELFKYKHTFVQNQLGKAFQETSLNIKTRSASLKAIMNFPVTVLMLTYQYLWALGYGSELPDEAADAKHEKFKRHLLVASQDISSFDVVALREEWKNRIWCAYFWFCMVKLSIHCSWQFSIFSSHEFWVSRSAFFEFPWVVTAIFAYL